MIMMMRMSFSSWVLLTLTLTSSSVSGSAQVSVTRSELGGNSIRALSFVDRVYVPYGPDMVNGQAPSDQPWTGYGYGTGSTEHYAYDWYNGYVYSQSEVGAYVTVLDFAEFPATVTPYSIDASSYNSEVKDVVVCPEAGLLFLSLADADTVQMYETVKRDDPATPRFLKNINAGTTPDAMKVNDDCTILAVANQNEGRKLLTAGALTLVTDFRGSAGPVVHQIDISGFTDAEMIANGVHMPMTQQAMAYWNVHSAIADDLEWDELMKDENYDPALFLDPEFIAFNADSTELYLNLQDNSAIARVDLTTFETKRIDGMGLKSWAVDGVDLVKDDGCELFVSHPRLYSTYAPDGIASVRVDGIDYVLTADEGSDLDFDDYEEKYDSDDVFVGNTMGDDLPGFIWAEGRTDVGLAAHLNADCDEDDEATSWCSGIEMTVGSSAVDYSNASQPVLEKIVTIGGRGMSILRVPPSMDEPMKVIWSSGDEFEREGCAQFPWAHNGVQDEEYAEVDGTAWVLYEDRREDIQELNDPDEDGCEAEPDAEPPLFGLPGACPISRTIDEKSPEDGLGVESVVVGVACSTLVAVACGENNGNCYLYDISDIERPTLLQVFNLSPASQTQNPAYAYRQRTLGDIDAETTLFVTAAHSPTGRDGVLFGGAISGTLSFYEFTCTTDVPPVPREGNFATPNTEQDQEPQQEQQPLEGNVNKTSNLGPGPIAGIVVAVIAMVAILAGIFFCRPDKSPTQDVAEVAVNSNIS